MYKRYLALLTALALLCALLTGCGSGNQQDTDQSAQTDTESAQSAETGEDKTEAVAEIPALELTDEIRNDPVAYLTDGAIQKNDVVMTVDGTDITADAFFYMLSYQYYQASSMAASYGMSLDVSQATDEEGTTTIADSMFSYTRQNCQQEALLANHAEALGLELSEEQQTQMDSLEEFLNDQIALFYSSTLDAIRWSNRVSLLSSRLNDYYYGEDGVDAPTNDTLTDYADVNGMYTCRYILLRTDDLEKDDADGKAAQQAKAQELYDQMKDLTGPDLLSKFCELQAEFNADGNTSPFSFDSTTTLVDGFREKIAELKPGELGLTDETNYGYFVVLRLDPDLTPVRTAYASERFNALVDEWVSESTVTAAEVLDSLNPVDCLNRMQALQTAVLTELQAQQAEENAAAAAESAAAESAAAESAAAENAEAKEDTADAEDTADETGAETAETEETP